MHKLAAQTACQLLNVLCVALQTKMASDASEVSESKPVSCNIAMMRVQALAMFVHNLTCYLLKM